MSTGKRGDFAEVKLTFLPPGERADTLPEDTRATAFEGWIKGSLLDDAEIGEQALIETATGRRISGILVRLQPAYEHTFGPPHTALSNVGRELRALLFAEDSP